MNVILIAEDNDGLRVGLKEALEDSGYTVLEAVDGKEALRRLKEYEIDLLIADIRMPGMDGMHLLAEWKKINPTSPVIIITAYPSTELAVEAMKKGAWDFVTKPFSVEEMRVKVDRAFKERETRRSRDYYREIERSRYVLENFIGQSPKIVQIKETVKKIANTPATVLLQGETGTGKELIAGAIHYYSDRMNKPFIKVNCAALTETLLESELFGHEKGAFTGADRMRKGKFEEADEGTLFLDEIADMSSSAQAKILRVLQEKEFERVGSSKPIKVNVRIIAATSKDLRNSMREGKFREELYYRLKVVMINLPPLRKRKEDISLLVDFFIKKYSTELRKQIEGIESKALEILERYDWPGNVRELENTVERAVIMATSDHITAEDLSMGKYVDSVSKKKFTLDIPSEGIELREVEKELILRALENTNWSQKKAAELLGITPRSINYKIKKFSLKPTYS